MTAAALGMRAMRAPDGTETLRLWNGENPDGIDLQPHNALWLIQALAERLHIDTDGRATLSKVVDVSWEEFEGGRSAQKIDEDTDALAEDLLDALQGTALAQKKAPSVAELDAAILTMAANLQIAGWRKVSR